MRSRLLTGPLPQTTAAGVRALAARAEQVDGIAPLSEEPLLRLVDPTAPVRHLLLTGADAARVRGYAQLALDDPAAPLVELVVDPADRRHGLGRQLLDGATLAAGRVPLVWAHGDLPAARALAAAAGLVPVEQLWRMRAALTTPPAVPDLPDGLVLRSFVPGRDEDALVRLNARAFAHHPDQGRWTRHDVLAREAEPWFDPAGLLLLERSGTPVGFVWTKVHPAGELEAVPVGELYVVGVDPDAQGAGLGGLLTALGLRVLADHGLTAAVLWTSGDNARAVRTYRRAGFVPAVVDVRYGPPEPGTPDPVGPDAPEGATMAP